MGSMGTSDDEPFARDAGQATDGRGDRTGGGFDQERPDGTPTYAVPSAGDATTGCAGARATGTRSRRVIGGGGMSSGGSWRCEACRCGFSSITSFDMHRVGEFASAASAGRPSTRRCLSVAEMRAKGMTLTRRGWTTGREFNRETGAA